MAGQVIAPQGRLLANEACLGSEEASRTPDHVWGFPICREQLRLATALN